MGWFYLFCATVFEVVGVTGLKKLSQKKNFLHTLFLLGGFGGSFLFLYRSLAYLDMSLAYAVWTGLGTASAVFLNMFFFGEKKTCRKVASVFVIILGVVGLKLAS